MFNRDLVCALCLPLAIGSASLSMAAEGVDRSVSEDRVVTVEVEGGPIRVVPGRVIQIAAGGQVEMKKVAYMGVSTSPVSPQLASDLKLPVGFGLVVDHAEEGGPAAKAGMKAGDVLIRLGDQRLVNAMQLGTLVRAQKPGDEVEFTVLRDGKELTIKATLSEKEMPAVDVLLSPRERLDRKAMQSSMRFADDEHQLEISHDKEGRSLIVKDKEGKEIFNGPINTPQERKAVPEAVQPKLEKLEKSSRMRIRQLPPGLVPGVVPGGEFDIEIIAPFDAQQIKKLIEDQLKGIELDGDQARDLQQRVEEMKRQVDEAMQKMRVQQEEMRARIQQGALPAPVPGQNEIQRHEVRQSQAVAKMNDGTHEITLTSNESGRHLTIKDKSGKELFNGPINTDKEKAAIPQDLREKLERLEKSVKLDVLGSQKP